MNHLVMLKLDRFLNQADLRVLKVEPIMVIDILLVAEALLGVTTVKIVLGARMPRQKPPIHTTQRRAGIL